MISVAVCDDEKVIREYIRSAVLDGLAEMDLDGRVTEFDDGEPLCAAYENGSADFDLILLDITMKRCDGLSAAKRIRETDRNVMIVFITASAEYGTVAASLDGKGRLIGYGCLVVVADEAVFDADAPESIDLWVEVLGCHRQIALRSVIHVVAVDDGLVHSNIRLGGCLGETDRECGLVEILGWLTRRA